MYLSIGVDERRKKNDVITRPERNTDNHRNDYTNSQASDMDLYEIPNDRVSEVIYDNPDFTRRR